MSNLIERLKALIPKGDGYNSDYSQTIQEAIAALSPAPPDDVQGALEWLSEFRGEDAEYCKQLIERLAREVKIKEVFAASQNKLIGELQAKIKELEEAEQPDVPAYEGKIEALEAVIDEQKTQIKWWIAQTKLEQGAYLKSLQEDKTDD